MLKEVYWELRRELAREGVLQVNGFYGALTAAAEILFFAAGATLLWRVERFSLAYWLLEVVLAFSIFRVSSLMHECAHGVMFKQKPLNTFLGILFSPVCLIPYLPYRAVHEEHHRWVGVIDRDPTQKGLLAMKRFSPAEGRLFRWIWRLWLPLPFMVFILNTYWLLPFRELREGRTRDGWQGLASALLALAPHGLAVAFLGPGEYLSLYGVMLFLFYIQLENMYVPQHSRLFRHLFRDHPHPVPIFEQDAVTRSSRLSPIWAVWLGYNHNLHTEHHLFPTAPWYRLPLVRRRLKDLDEQCTYTEVSCLGFMSEVRRQDPLSGYLKSFPQEKAS